MRGGVTSEQLLYSLTYEDRKIIQKIVKENIKTTQESRMPLL